MLQQFCHKCLHKINIPKLLQNLEYTSDNPRRTVEKMAWNCTDQYSQWVLQWSNVTLHCEWWHCYQKLRQRTQRIVYVNTDVPQGSLLEPLLFWEMQISMPTAHSLLFYSSWLLPSYWRVACQNFGTEFVTPPAFKNKDHMFYLT